MALWVKTCTLLDEIVLAFEVVLEWNPVFDFGSGCRLVKCEMEVVISLASWANL